MSTTGAQRYLIDTERPAASLYCTAPEGDGYIITLLHRAATNTSELLILPAQDIAGDPAAVLVVPRRVPGGFMGALSPGRVG